MTAPRPEDTDFDPTLPGSPAPGTGQKDVAHTLADTLRLSGSAAEGGGGTTPGGSVPLKPMPPMGEEEAPSPLGPLPCTFGEYDLLEEIARGGMGIVYKARQRNLDRIVALKTIREGQLTTPTSILRFRQEAKVAAGMDHPHIVPIYDIGQERGMHFFTMAYVEGESLRHHVVRRGPLPPRDAVALTLPVVEAIGFAHRQGIIHRDLKPDNVLLDKQGRPRVTDFGLAKRMEGDVGLTASGQILGTPVFMSPEQALGGQRVIGPPADIYALGGILYYLLTGKPPFLGETTTEVLCQVVQQAPLPPRAHVPDLPLPLQDVCLKCLEKDPGMRFPTAEALADVLRELAAADFGPTPAFRAAVPAAPGAPHDSTLIATAQAPGMAPLGMPTSSSAGASPHAAEPLSTPPATRSGPMVVAGLAIAALAVGLLLWRLGIFGTGTDPKEPLAGPGPKEIGKKFPGFPKKSRLQSVLSQEMQADFGLKVELIGARLQEDGFLLREGEDLVFRLSVERDAFVGIWTVDAKGEVTQLFPNEFEQDALVKAGQPRIVPGAAYELSAVPSTGPEQIRVLASTRPLQLLTSKGKGPFAVFRSEQWESTLRGLVLKAAAKSREPFASEQSFQYRVEPKK